MPDQPQDNLEKLSGPIYQPVQPTFNPPQQQVSGWGGKGVGIANIATQFLAGVSKGRAAAYNRQQQGEMKQVASLQSAMQAVDASGASEDVKNQQRTELFRTYGRLIQGSLPDSSKGKKGGDPAGGAEQPHPMQHVLNGIKGALDSALGPAPKKNELGPEAINATLGKVFAAISDPNNSQKAFSQKIEQPVTAAYGELQQKLGHPPTFAEMEAYQPFRDAAAQNAASNNGNFTPGVATLIQSGQQVEKDQQAQAIEKMKADAAAKKEESAEKARLDAQKDRDAAADKRASERDKAEDKRSTEREYHEDIRASNRERHEDARVQLRSNGTGDRDDVRENAAGIIDGSLPPDMTRFYGKASKVEAELHRHGYNLVAAKRDWEAVTRHISTLNGPQQTRIMENVNALHEMIPKISDAYDEWQGTKLPGGFRAYNKAALLAASQVPGENGKKAQNLITYINDAVSETGQIYMGGNSPTDHALQMAEKNLQGDWNPETFKSSLDILESNLAIRRNSILNAPVMGANPNSPYVPDNMRDTAGSGKSTQAPPQPQASGIQTQAPPQARQASGATQAPPAAPAVKAPSVGTVENGYKFVGGDPANQKSWQKVQ